MGLLPLFPRRASIPAVWDLRRVDKAMEPWILQMCRKASFRMVVTTGIVFAVVLVLALANLRYFRNFFSGPYPIGAADLAQISDVDTTPRYFVSIPVEKVVDTGVQEITTTETNGVKTGEYVSAAYYGVLVGDRFLIVKSAAKPANRVEGALSMIPSDLSGHLFTGPDAQETRKHCYAFYLDGGSFREGGYWAMGIGALVLGLMAFAGFRAWNRVRDIHTHPVAMRVAKWGDPMSISMNAEREYANAVRYKSSGVILTDNFAFEKSVFGFQIYRLQDLLWTYKKVTKRSVNFVPVGKYYTAELKFYGGNLTFSGKEKAVEEVLIYASKRAPWAVLGYSEDLKKMFSKQQAAFCQGVEARRQKLAAQGSA